MVYVSFFILFVTCIVFFYILNDNNTINRNKINDLEFRLGSMEKATTENNKFIFASLKDITQEQLHHAKHLQAKAKKVKK